MAEVMVALAGQLQTYFKRAEDLAAQRFEELRNSIVEEFSRPGTTAEPEAFQDPDYQYVLRSAHESFARRGDEELKRELVRLLAERSSRAPQSRTALVLNEAIGLAGRLTKQELAALAMLFLFKYVRLGATGPIQLLENIRKCIQVFVDDLPTDDNAFEYLEALRCCSINHITSVEFWNVITSVYAPTLSSGFMFYEVNQFGRPLNIPVVGIGSGLVRFAVENSEDLRQKMQNNGFDEKETAKVVELYERSLWSPDKVQEEFRERVPELPRLVEVWQKTVMNKTVLTSLGKTLGHSALVNSAGFEAPLEIWVK